MFLVAGVSALTIRWSTSSKPLFKVHAWFGEDAFVASGSSAVVTDGVGGYHAKHGISSAGVANKYAKALQSRLGKTDFSRAVSGAWRSVTAPGACVFAAACYEEGALSYAAVGDASVRVYRESRCIARAGGSSGYGAPAQLWIGPDGTRDGKALNGMAVKRCVLQSGDLILLCTDGVTDNLEEGDMARKAASASGIVDSAKCAGRKDDDITAIVGVCC